MRGSLRCDKWNGSDPPVFNPISTFKVQIPRLKTDCVDCDICEQRAGWGH